MGLMVHCYWHQWVYLLSQVGVGDADSLFFLDKKETWNELRQSVQSYATATSISNDDASRALFDAIAPLTDKNLQPLGRMEKWVHTKFLERLLLIVLHNFAISFPIYDILASVWEVSGYGY